MIKCLFRVLPTFFTFQVPNLNITIHYSDIKFSKKLKIKYHKTDKYILGKWTDESSSINTFVSSTKKILNNFWQL